MLQRFLEFALIPVLRLMVGTFFRKIEITGVENVPPDAPVIYTPNHVNSLVDGILARTQLPREPRPLAAFKLWNVAALKPLLTAVRAIPVYRQQDSQDPQYVENNRDSFSACYEALARKYCIVVFPEGESHAGSELQKLKTGVARIALGAEQHYGPLGVRIVPVGLNFDAKQKFRSRVLLSIGKPIDPIAELQVVDAEDRGAVTAVMDRVEQGIKSVTLNYPSWEEAKLIQRAAVLYAAKKHRDTEPEESLAEEFSRQSEGQA